MAKNKHQKISSETQDDALRMAKATQRPGQTKEQTKLITQGIQKGIDQYKKQQKAKSRELNKKRHKVSQKLIDSDAHSEPQRETNIVYQQAKLPWVLLTLSWIAFAIYVFMPFDKGML